MKFKSIVLAVAAITLCGCNHSQSISVAGEPVHILAVNSSRFYKVGTNQILTMSDYKVNDVYTYYNSEGWRLNGDNFNYKGDTLMYAVTIYSSAFLNITVKVKDKDGAQIFFKDYFGAYDVSLTTEGE